MVRSDDFIKDKISDNLLQDLLMSLADLLLTHSKESQELESEKNKQVQPIWYPAESETNPQHTASSSQSETLPHTQYRSPTLYETPKSNKRKVSDTSFGTHSTESTPNKLLHAESKVQALQNIFVKTIINKLWQGAIDVPWVKGRHMFLNYNELRYFSFQHSLQ